MRDVCMKQRTAEPGVIILQHDACLSQFIQSYRPKSETDAQKARNVPVNEELRSEIS